MPEPKGRRNRRDRDRERRRTREPRAPLSDEERRERDMRAALGSADAPRRAAAPLRSDDLMVLPSVRVRLTGAMVGVITTLGAAYMVIAGILNGSGVDSIISVGAGVIMLGVGSFVVALVLFPKQIRDFVRGGR